MQGKLTRGRPAGRAAGRGGSKAPRPRRSRAARALSIPLRTVNCDHMGFNIDASALTNATTPATFVAPRTAGNAAAPPAASCAQVAAAEAKLSASSAAVLLTVPSTLMGALEPYLDSTMASFRWPKPVNAGLVVLGANAAGACGARRAGGARGPGGGRGAGGARGRRALVRVRRRNLWHRGTQKPADQSHTITQGPRHSLDASQPLSWDHPSHCAAAAAVQQRAARRAPDFSGVSKPCTRSCLSAPTQSHPHMNLVQSRLLPPSLHGRPRVCCMGRALANRVLPLASIMVLDVMLSVRPLWQVPSLVVECRGACVGSAALCVRCLCLLSLSKLATYETLDASRYGLIKARSASHPQVTGLSHRARKLPSRTRSPNWAG